MIPAILSALKHMRDKSGGVYLDRDQLHALMFLLGDVNNCAADVKDELKFALSDLSGALGNELPAFKCAGNPSDSDCGGERGA